MKRTNGIGIGESGIGRREDNCTKRRQDESPSRTVQFYEREEVLATSASRFLAEALAAGKPALVVARRRTFEQVQSELEQRDVDVVHAVQTKRLCVLDAEVTFSSITYRGVPERERFSRRIEREIERLTGGDRSVSFVVYSEMVDILRRAHDMTNALRLEEFWKDLTAKYSFALLCAYSIERFPTASDTCHVASSGDVQTQVLVAADDGAPHDIEGARSDVARLQQQTRNLTTEIEYRKQLEHVLRQNKRELEEFCDNAPEGIHRVAADGTILWANKAELELFGWSSDEYIGHRILEFCADEHLHADILARLNRGEALRDHELRVRCKDGSIRHVIVNTSVVRARHGFVHNGFTRDITARKHAEDSLRFIAEAGAVLASSLDYESTLNTVCRMCVPRLADWASVELKVDGSIRRVALAHSDPKKVAVAQELWHRTPTRIDQPHGVANVLRTGNAEIMNEIGGDLLEHAISDVEVRETFRRFGLRSMMRVPLLEGSEAIGAVVFFNAESGRVFDRSDLPLAEELARRASVAIQNARLYKDAQTATRLKDEFLATISHELRTPLTAILGWARMLRTGNVGPANLDRALDSIERNSIAQVQLVEDLLDVSRIISGKLRLDVQSLDLVPVVEGAIESMQQAMAAKNIQFFHVVDPSACLISGDPHRLQQVIWNLLSNAVKFTPKGGSVRLLVERVDACVQLTVSDTGQGIPAAILSSIFERFKQADGNTARVHGGLGLGLAIVRHIVELHGGTVEAQSEGEGRGATFVVQLPVLPVRADTEGPFRHRRKDARPPIERPTELQGLTVLVVDDESDTREILAEVLQQCGCSVLTASGTEDALAILDRASPRVAVCDIGMPGLDGYEFIDRVRKRPADKGGRIVAVALTAFAGAEDRRRALRAGYQMHVAKPVEPAEFVAVLANLAQLAIAMS